MYGKSMINWKCVQEMNGFLYLKILLKIFLTAFSLKIIYINVIFYYLDIILYSSVVVREKLYKSALTI